MKILLNAGADKDVRNDEGSTSLHWASKNGHIEIVKLLLDAGADKDVVNNGGMTPLRWAITKSHTDIVPDPLHVTRSPSLPQSRTLIYATCRRPYPYM